MRKNIFLNLLFCLLVLAAQLSAASISEQFTWSELPELPPVSDQTVQPGIAGPFVGTHNGALIVAGGANFPEKAPWNGGQKVWRNDIFVLLPDAESWQNQADALLPRPLAYGVSITTPNGIICIGGCDAERCYPDVFQMSWNSVTHTIETDTLPSLPFPLAFANGALLGNTVYVAGGQQQMVNAAASAAFLALDLTAPEKGWQVLPGWPGDPRVFPVVVAQSNGVHDCFYLFSGRNVQPGMPIQLLTDGYEFTPKFGSWKKMEPIQVTGDNAARCLMGASSLASGANNILVFGGDDGQIFNRLNDLGQQISNAKADGNSRLAARLTAEKISLLEEHPGFNSDILSFNTITDTWTKIDKMPGISPVTTTAVRWNNQIIIPTGEIRPGVRTPKVLAGEIEIIRHFGWINYLVLGIYLLALVGMGFYFSTREKSTDDFFRAGGRIPWWAAGLSIFGTGLSAITFMAVPAKAFATDWRYMWSNWAQVLIAPVIIFMILPFFRRLNVTTAYEYLEKRFNLLTRLLGSLLFLIFQFGRIGIVLFLPSIALSVVTGIDIQTCILVMGILSIIYTVLGGIEAVIWTDVLQVIVLMGGALISLVLILTHLDGGIDTFMTIARADHKMYALDLNFTLKQPTFWVVMFGGLAANLISYSSDQAYIQRYLTTKDEKSAAKSIWTNAALAIPTVILFMALGTALFAFFKTTPLELGYTMASTDAVFPWYIVTQLPDGVAGILIAGIFAASMSSLDSSMNSSATTITTDWFRRFKPDVSDVSCLKFARWVTVIVGVAGIIFALMMTTSDIKSLWDQFSKYIGLLTGGLGGVFLLGIISRRANGIGALAGLIGSGVVQYFVSRSGAVHLLLYSFSGLISCLLIGYIVSVLFPRSKDIDGLTIYTLKK